MNIEFAIPAKNVKVINPSGTVAICTLWTPPEFVEAGLREAAPHLFQDKSPLAVIGGLYGGGLKIMLRNLIHNPQIDTVVIYGKDHSGAGRHLELFFMGQVERTGQRQIYIFDDGRREELEKVAIVGGESKYYMDELILPGSFQHPPRVVDLSPDAKDPADLALWFETYRSPGQALTKRVLTKRVLIPLPLPEVDSFPSDREAHLIAADSIFEAWPKLLFKLSRFGVPVEFRSGKRRNELLNMKVVIRDPGAYSRSELKRFNISPKEVKEYQDELLAPGCAGDSRNKYTYGQRLGSHFGMDLLKAVADDLCLDKDSRHNLAVLWDNRLDLAGGEDPPCLTTLFFRKIEGRVNLTATFRSHNGARAWPRNCLGLSAVMKAVCDKANDRPGKTDPFCLRPGSLTVFSQSISIDLGDLEGVAGFIAEYLKKPARMILDPNGYFKITIDLSAREIVAYHFSQENELLEEYRGRSPSAIAGRLYKHEAVSDMSHALYLGSQLERAWFCLENGVEYTQDKIGPLKLLKGKKPV